MNKEDLNGNCYFLTLLLAGIVFACLALICSSLSLFAGKADGGMFL